MSGSSFAAHPPRPGPDALKKRLSEILRVDHAGELGAVYIYRGQRAVLDRLGPDRAAKLAHMEAQEKVHLEAFESLLSERGVRPTLMSPLWRLAAFAMGAGTALISEKAAHACTEAVENVIEGHYAGQIEELTGREPDLASALTKFRDDELEHRDEAIASGAQEAIAYPLLYGAIQGACRLAIKVSEKL